MSLGALPKPCRIPGMTLGRIDHPKKFRNRVHS
jgi:hypothetical protein